MKVTVGILLPVIIGAILFAVFEPIQVLPRMRLAPGYSLDTTQGEAFTSESVRGTVTLYSFVGDECDSDCRESLETMETVQRRVREEIDFRDVEFQLVTITGDATVGVDKPWAFITGGNEELRTLVSSGFERPFQPGTTGLGTIDRGFVLVDGNGIVRGDYRYKTLAANDDKLVRHIDLLAAELRHAGGPSSVAYETAHLFLCYP